MKNLIIRVISPFIKWEYYNREFTVLNLSDKRFTHFLLRPCRKAKVFGKEIKQYKIGRPKDYIESSWENYNETTIFYA